MVNVEMAESKSMDGVGAGGGSQSSSSLEMMLQQAWIKSQVPKVQRRSLSAPAVDVSLEKRACAQQPSAELLWGLVSGRAGDADELAKTYFHKTRAEASSEFCEKLATPQLESFSEKTDVPRSSSSNCTTSRSFSMPSSSDKSSSQDLRSTVLSAGESFVSDLQTPLPDGSLDVVDFEGISSGSKSTDGVDFEGASSGLEDLAAQTEPLASFFDDYLTDENLEEESSMLLQTSAYEAMAKEIADLLGPNPASVDDFGEPEVVEGVCENYWSNAEFLPVEDISEVEKGIAYQAMAKEIAELLSPGEIELDAGASEVLNYENGGGTGFWSADGQAAFRPTDEQTTLKLMEVYASMLSRHLFDVNDGSSNDVDYRSWITESEEPAFDLDGHWKYYLDRLPQTSTFHSAFQDVLVSQEVGLDLCRSSAVLPSCTMTELLYRCALAVSQGNKGSVADYLAQLRSRTSPHGDFMERMGYYFMEALIAKLSGTGEQLYTQIVNNFPPVATMLRAFRKHVDHSPYIKIIHFFQMKTALDAFEGASRVHVIHYGVHFGVEWPSLIQHLSLRPEGPPHFRMTGIDVPHPGDDPCRKIRVTGERLAKFAEKWGVDFEFHALAGNWETFTAKDFDLRDDEVLVVLCYKMHLVTDECVVGVSPRDLILRRIRSLNPKVFVMVCVNAACNAPLFMTRFRESVKVFTAMFNGLELSMPPDDPDRVIIEREMLGREIFNIVACDGKARLERAEPYRSWHNRLLRAGFQQRQPKEIIYSKIKAMMGTFHKDFGVGRDEGWVLLGIHNQIVKAFSAWEPKPVLGLIAS